MNDDLNPADVQELWTLKNYTNHMNLRPKQYIYKTLTLIMTGEFIVKVNDKQIVPLIVAQILHYPSTFSKAALK